jgi:hypothetical protein
MARLQEVPHMLYSSVHLYTYSTTTTPDPYTTAYSDTDVGGYL